MARTTVIDERLLDDQRQQALLLVGFSVAIAALLGSNLAFNKLHLDGSLAILSLADMCDLLLPYVLIPFYYRLAFLDGQRWRSVPWFLCAAVVFIQGHSLHNAANSIANALEACGLHVRSPQHPDSLVLPLVPRLGDGETVATLVDFYDEKLSHILWMSGIVMLESCVLFPHLGRTLARRAEQTLPPLSAFLRLLLVAASLFYSASFFGSCIEGQTVSIGLPFCLLVLSVRLAGGFPPSSRSPIVLYFSASAVTVILAFAGYALMWKDFLLEHARLPEFSEVTSLFHRP